MVGKIVKINKITEDKIKKIKEINFKFNQRNLNKL